MIGVTFETAWSPISPIIAELATQFPKLKFDYSYYESGCDFWGKLLYKKAELVSEDFGELSKASCEVRMELEGDAHHWCDDCGDSFSCSDELTPTLCSECLSAQMEQDKELWDTSIEEKESANDYATAI